MKGLIVVLLLGVCSSVFASDPKYPVSEIPEGLKTDVNVVIRKDQMTFRIHSKSKATLSVLMVATIMNPNGNRYAQTRIGYDKLSKITELRGSAYDAQGNLIKKLKSNEITDQSVFDGFSLYSDARYKSANLSQNSYPYTIEFEYEVEYKYLFMIPGTTILPAEKIAVEKAGYTLIYPDGLAPRYKAFNTAVQPVEERTTDGFKKLSWNFENVEPIKFEPLGPSPLLLVPRIVAAPSTFEYDGYSGTMDTWKDFGKWITSLNAGRDVLPAATKLKAEQLTANLENNEAKVRALYYYLQSKTRYVSIQLGIGGFQPFEAAVVDETGYGDCKALSNYMVSMLKAIGIKSHYVLIQAGSDATPLLEDFPSSQFNHAIVAVPNGSDTLWLECTSQTKPFGYMGSFTGDRKALLITNEGATIAKTIQYSANQNSQYRSAEVFLESNGNATASVKTIYSGLQYENGGLYPAISNKFDDQKKWVQENTSIPSFDITKFNMVDVKDKVPSAVVSVDLELRRFATVSGKRIFLNPNLMNRITFVPEKVNTRKTNVVKRMSYTDVDTIRYHLPEGIYPEFLPEPVKLKSRFGEYEAHFTLNQDNLIYVRRVKMNKGEFPPESYAELIEFYRNLNKADNIKLVFMSKT